MIQHEFLKGSLVNLMSEITYLVFYLLAYSLVHSSNWRLKYQFFHRFVVQKVYCHIDLINITAVR